MSFKKLPIATALALETVAEPNKDRISDEREIPKYEKELEDIEIIVFDVFSLARDVINGLSKDSISLPLAVHNLKSAVAGINEITEFMGITQFINSYEYTYRYKEHHIIHKENTMVGDRMDLLNRLMRNFNPSIYGIVLQKGIPYERALLFSHHAYFIASMREIGKKLRVLESHTGRVLTNETLNLKYRNVKSYDRKLLPFHKRLLLVLGDGNLIKAKSSKYIKEVIEVSRKWNINTPDETVKNALKRISE